MARFPGLAEHSLQPGYADFDASQGLTQVFGMHLRGCAGSPPQQFADRRNSPLTLAPGFTLQQIIVINAEKGRINQNSEYSESSVDDLCLAVSVQPPLNGDGDFILG